MANNRPVFALPPDSLIPTNMEGVYTFRPLPDDLDLDSADDATLASYGIFLPRPKAGGDPALKAIWNKISSRKWRTIVPQIGPLKRHSKLLSLKSQGLKKIPGRRGGTSMPPSQPGYATCTLFSRPGPPWNTVYATWACPTLSPPPQGLPKGNSPELEWLVGLDGGEQTNGVLINREGLQAGLIQTLFPSTISPPLWTWFAPDPTDPNASDSIGGELSNFPQINVGDEVMFSVSYFFTHPPGLPVRPGLSILRGAMSFRNVTQSLTTAVLFFPPQGATAAGASIEWELQNLNYLDPGLGMEPVVPAFTPMSFSNAGPGNPGTGAVVFDMQDTTIAGSPVAVVVTPSDAAVGMSFK
jgi:hypothetical protein